MSLNIRSLVITTFGIFCLQNTAFAQFTNPFGTQKTIAQQREDILKTSSETLKKLYQVQPKAKELVDKSIGYATFSNFGMKILIAGGGTGSGVVLKKDGAKPIYMNMAEVQAGLGFGIKSFQNIFVFETQAALNDFVNSGWSFGGQVTAAAKYDNNGEAYQDAVAVAPGVLMYQLTDSGLAAEITGKGTKYYKSPDLN
jgi:lipid-binding SYLF domain-containing protein